MICTNIQSCYCIGWFNTGFQIFFSDTNCKFEWFTAEVSAIASYKAQVINMQ